MEDKRRKWLKSHHDTLFPFFPFLKKRDIGWLFDSTILHGPMYFLYPYEGTPFREYVKIRKLDSGRGENMA
jgi:hypothetical protein